MLGAHSTYNHVFILVLHVVHNPQASGQLEYTWMRGQM